MRFNANQVREMKEKARAAGLASGRRWGRLTTLVFVFVGWAIGTAYQCARPNDMHAVAAWLRAQFAQEAGQ